MSVQVLKVRAVPRFAAGFAIALLSGCAVLRIDVDVYKGPLANHEEVQLRQYGALALAAKPVLIQLRNLYEPNLPTQYHSTAHVKDHKFKSTIAQRLNEALSFYEPQGTPGVRDFLDEARPSASRLMDSSALLNRGEMDRALYQRLREALGSAHGNAGGANLARTCLGRAYMLFLDGQSKDDLVFVRNNCEHSTEAASDSGRNELVVTYEPTSDRFAVVLQRACVAAKREDPALNCARGEVSNAVFEMLSDSDEVSRQLRALPVALPKALANDLRDHVVKVSRAYGTARTDLNALFRASLRLLDASRQVDIQQRTGRILGDVTQLRNFACAYRIRDMLHVAAPAAVESVFKGHAALGPSVYWTQSDGDDYERFKPVFVSAIERHPAAMARLLHDLDGAFRNASDETLSGCRSISDKREFFAMQAKASRRFGLVRGPSLDPVELRSLQIRLEASFEALQQLSGFEQGRFRAGIGDLVQDYVNLVEEAPSHQTLDREKLRRASQRLEEMLLIFAEKILYIANNQTLLEEGSGERTGGSGVSVRYVLTLQSIGNSILSFANDVRFRRDHVKRGQDREPAERKAAIVSQRSGAPLVLDAVLAELRARAVTAADSLAKLPAARPASSGTAPAIDVVTLRQRLVHAYRTVSGKAGDVPGLPKIDAAQSGQLADSAQGITAKLGKLADKVTGEEIRKAIEDWINTEYEQIAVAARDSARAERLREAREHFKSATVDFAALIPASSDRKEAVKATMAKLRRDYDETLALIRSAEAAAKARTVQTTEASNRAKDEARKSEMDGAVKLFEASRGGILAALAASGETDPKAIVEAISRKLRADMQGKSGAELKTYETALAELEGMRGGLRLPDLKVERTERAAEGSHKGTARDVLDDVLATLRYARIQASAAGDTVGVENIDKAIKFSYEQRGGFAYLRPASAYLRNVYSGTALQSDPRISWSNMLREHSERALPILGEFFITGGEELRKVKAEVDRQFWQNINSVRVAGGGSTNYVLAKDDTGNWYVKGYEADPASVIRSARGLMLFNLGRSMDTNLLARSDIMQELGTKGLDSARRTELNDQLKKLDESDKTRGGSGLSSALGRFRQSYRTRLKDDFTALKTDLDSGTIATLLQNAWTAKVPSYKDALDTVSKADAAELKDAAAALVEPKTTDGAKLAQAHVDGFLDALRQVRRYHATVLAHVAKIVQPVSVAALQEQERLKQGALTEREGDMKLAESQYVTALENHRKAADDPARLAAQQEVDKQKGVRDLANAALVKAQGEYNTAKQNLATAQVGAQKAAADRDTATKEATRIILGFISRHGNRRLAAAQQFEDSVTFLSAGTN